MLSEEARTHRVERPHPHAGRLRSKEVRDAIAHLPRGLVRERDGENPFGRNAVLLHEMTDSSGQNPCLARPGARQNQHGPLEMHRGLELVRVEAC